MSARDPCADLRRILVAMDQGPSARATLETAASLAAALHAELVGLFVEDTELLAAADLPVTHSIPRFARERALLDAASMERAMRVSAHRANVAVAAVAERLRLHWSFRVLRGGLAEELLREVRAFDVLALDAAGSAMHRAMRELASGWSEAREANCALLLAGPAGDPRQPVTVLFEGTERALALGRRLAEVYGRRLAVVAVGESEAATEEVGARAAAWLETHGVHATVSTLLGGTVADVCAALRARFAGVLVIDRRGPLGARLPLEALAGRAGGAVFALN